MLFGTDGKKESPFKHLLRIKDEEPDEETSRQQQQQQQQQQQDEAGDFTVQFEMDMDSSEKCDDDNSGATGTGSGTGSYDPSGGSGSCSDVPSSSSDHESLPRDPCSSDSINELFESLTGCPACSQLQQQTDNNNIGASHLNSAAAFVTAATGLCDHVCSAAGGGGAPHRPRGHPLYRRRSSGKVTTTTATTGGNIPSIPKSTENQVPDDTPDSGDLNLQELFGSLSAVSEMQQQQQQQEQQQLQQKLNADSDEDTLTLQNQSSMITSSSSSLSSSFSVYSDNTSNSLSLPSNNGSITTTSRLLSNQNTFSLNGSNSNSVATATTGNCLNSVNSDCSVFSAQTLPVVVVATGMGLNRKSSSTETSGRDYQSMPQATFHWTLDDSNCQEDAEEALLSPLVMEPSELGEVMGTAHDTSTMFSFSHVQENELIEEPTTSSADLLGNPEMLSSLCLSQLGEENDVVRIELPQVGDSMEKAASLPSPSVMIPPVGGGLGGGEGLDRDGCDGGGGESLVSPLVVHHLEVQQQSRHVRGSSLSSDDGDGGVDQAAHLAAGPRIDSAELRLNLDFILDNSDDEDEDHHDHGQPDHDVISGASCGGAIDLSYHGSHHHQNEGPSDLDLDLHDPEVYEDLASELKRNLDFIDDEDQPGDLSLEDVFISEPSSPGATTTVTTTLQQQPPQGNSMYTGCGHLDTIHSGQISSSSATKTTTTSNICDTIANCESKNNVNSDVGATVGSCAADHNNSLLWFLSGDFGIWSSVFENVTSARSPHHFWPSQFTSQVAERSRSRSVTCLSLDGSDLCRSWGSSNGSSLFFNPLNPWGTTWPPISPHREEHGDQTTTSTYTSTTTAAACRPTSRLWDVNLQKFSSSEYESPRERCSTIENIQRYLMNLR